MGNRAGTASDMSKTTEEESKCRYSTMRFVMVLAEDRSPLMFTEDEFDRYFDINDAAHASVNLQKHDCATSPYCQCRRWDSFLCNHTLNHAKCGLPEHIALGRIDPPVLISAIFLLSGSVWGTPKTSFRIGNL